jgi:hypothetical protein
MYCNKNHSKLKRTASTQLKVPFGAPITVTRKLGRLLAHGEWCSRRPTGVIARRCSLCSSSLHQCMHGCVCAPQKAPKCMGVVRHSISTKSDGRPDGITTLGPELELCLRKSVLVFGLLPRLNDMLNLTVRTGQGIKF